MTHPLTDELCCEISVYPFEELTDVSAAETMTEMRAAADWQLEQVIRWLNEAIFEQSTCLDIESLPGELEKAMRPQQQEDNS